MPPLRWIKRLHFLSADVALGAWLSGNMAASCLRVEMPPAWQWVLPAATLFVYNLDHHLDALVLKDKAVSPRHRFHVQHAGAVRLGLLALLAVCTGGFWLPQPVVYAGLGVGLLTALHLLLVWLVGGRTSAWLVKEAGVALIYTAGIFAPVLVCYPAALPVLGWLLPAVFWLLVLMSLLIFSCYDLSTDQQQGQNSVVLAWGKKAIVRLSLWLGGLSAAGGLVLALFAPAPGLVCVLMAAVQTWIALDTWRFAQGDRYRWLGELVFWLPALGWWLT